MENSIWLYNYFTSRELALICWFLILFIILVKWKNTRIPLLNCIKILFSASVLKVIIAVSCYFILITFCLYKFNLWDFSLIKDSLVWFVFSGIALIFRSAQRNESFPHLKTLVTDNLKFTLFFEYVFNLYTFPFLVEFLLIPFQVFVGLMMGVAGTKEEYTPIKKFFESLMIIFGSFGFVYCIYMSIINASTIFNLSTLSSIRLPLYYSIAIFPLVFSIKVISEYQIAFIQLRTEKINDDKLTKYFKNRVRKTFKLNYFKLQNFVSYSNCQDMIFKSNKDIDSFIILYIKRNTLDEFNDKKPGFNPRIAERYFEEEGFTIDTYKYNGYDDGYGEYYTNMYKRFEGINVDTMSYSLQGNKECVLKIELEFDEFTLDKVINKGHNYFIKCVKILYQKAFNHNMPKDILKSVKKKEKKSFCVDNYYIKSNIETYPNNPNLVSYTFIISAPKAESLQNIQNKKKKVKK